MDIKMILELQRVEEEIYEIGIGRQNCQWMKVYW